MLSYMFSCIFDIFKDVVFATLKLLFDTFYLELNTHAVIDYYVLTFFLFEASENVRVVRGGIKKFVH